MPPQRTQPDVPPLPSPPKPPAKPPASPTAATASTRPPTSPPAATPQAAARAKTMEAINNPEVQKALATKHPPFLRALHGEGFSGMVLRDAYINTGGGKGLTDTAQDFELDIIRRLEPRDPLEQMLIDQMLWTHVRIGRLTMQAIRQDRIEPLKVTHEAADRALNAFRRHMLALQEYRSPKPAPSFTAINQQNIALMNGTRPQESQIKKVTNEKEPVDAPPQPKALPADTSSIDRLPQDGVPCVVFDDPQVPA
jgi:hypothetical protein